MLVGAVYGVDVIPVAWRQALHGRWPIRLEQTWWEQEFLALAGALVGVTAV